VRSIWRGAVSFGLVSIGVKLYSATEDHDIRFHQVHKTDGGRVKYKRVCSVDGEEVEYGDIAKGYELPDGWPDEIRRPGFAFLDEEVPVRPQELQMAESLISTMAGDFDAGAFTDDYREAMTALLEAKQSGGEVQAVPEAAEADGGAVVDLMSALRRSVERAGGTAPAGTDDEAADSAPDDAAQDDAAQDDAAQDDAAQNDAPAKRPAKRAAATKAAPAKAPAKKAAAKAPAKKAAAAGDAAEKPAKRAARPRKTA
jgi:DNA end-binding protein Ku